MAWYNSLKDLTGDISKGAENVGKAVKTGVTDTGHAVGTALDNQWVDAAIAAALAATGVGAPAAAAILGGSKLLGGAIAPGGNLGTAVKQGVEGAAEGGLAGALGGAGASGSGAAGGAIGQDGIPVISGIAQGVGNVASGLGSGITNLKNLLTGTSTLAPSAAGGAITSAAPAVAPAVGAVGGAAAGGAAAGGGIGGSSLLNDILLGGSIADKAFSTAKQNDLINAGLNSATSAYNANAPIRNLGLSELTNNKTPDLSSIFANPANPYYRASPPTQLGTAVPVTG